MFWQEQKRMLNKKKQTRWQPQVLSYCFYLWLKLGNSKFENLRDVMVLPSKRTLQLMKSNMPNGSGYQDDCFDALKLKLETHCKKESDWELSLFWDATGHAKYCWFDRKGVLEGFDCNPHSFNNLLMLAHKVIILTTYYCCMDTNILLQCINR